jgi:hypothetical protein
MRKAKQSTAKNVMVLMVGAADHITGIAGLTLTITASKDGAAFASIAPVVTDRGSGWYAIALTSSHTDTTGDLALHITGAAADPADIVLLVEAGATDADVSSRLATTGYTAPDNATITLIAGYTDSIEGRLPAALVGGRMDSSVGAMAADTVTASAIAAGAIGVSEAPLLANLDAAVSSRSAAGDAMTLTAGAVDAIWDDAVEGAYTARQLLRGFASALMAKLSGADVTAPTFRNLADTKDRITAITDSAGNRTSVTLDLT